MSDERLREVERRAREPGTPDDQAAWLVERLRMGRLTRRRLEAAAHCGHEGARLVLGTKPLPAPTREWARRLVEPGERELAVVALAAVARALFEHCAGLETDAEQRARIDLHAYLLDTLHAWRRTPTVRARQAVLDDMRGMVPGPISPRNEAEWVIRAANNAVGRAVQSVTAGKADVPGFFADGLGHVGEQVRRRLLPERMLESLVFPAVCADVVAWALADEPAGER